MASHLRNTLPFSCFLSLLVVSLTACSTAERPSNDDRQGFESYETRVVRSRPAPPAADDDASRSTPGAPASEVRPPRRAREDERETTEPVEAEKPPSPVAREVERPNSPRSPDSSREVVADYVRRLQSDGATAEAAFRELWRVPKRHIPALILQANDARPSGLREMNILVLEKNFSTFDENLGKHVFRIRGLGLFESDVIAPGPTRGRRGTRVRLRMWTRPFPIGLVVRAALLNRFQSVDFPRFDDRADIVRWWQAFYDRVRDRL